MWPFKKQEVDMVTIPDVVWAKNTSEGVAKDLEIKETKDLLGWIGRWIKNTTMHGKTRLRIDARYLDNKYKTPRWILRDNVVSALTSCGYEVDKGINLDYYLMIKWGEAPECPDLKPVSFVAPGIKKDKGE